MDDADVKYTRHWYRRGAALITTTLLGVVAAGMVLVLVTTTLVDVRSGYVVSELGAATDMARNAVFNYEKRLGENPLYYANVVDGAERARVCGAEVYQPNSAWPRACGSLWTYTAPQQPSGVLLEVRPPNPYNPLLEVVAVAKSGGVDAGWRATFKQNTANVWTLVADAGFTVPGYLNDASVYTGQALAGGGGRGLVAIAEAPGGLDELARGDGGVYLAGPFAREIVPSPLQTTALASSMTAAVEAGCGGASGVVSYEGRELSGRVCLRRGEDLVLRDGSQRQVPVNATRYLLVPLGNALAVYVSVRPNEAPQSNDRSQSLSALAAGTHPGGLSHWDLLGEVHPPASGVVATDVDVQIGLCGEAFAQGGDCVLWSGGVGAESAVGLTVVAGTAQRPSSVWLGGPVGGVGVSVAAFGEIRIPYWAGPPGQTVVWRAGLVALGRGVAGDGAGPSPIGVWPSGGVGEAGTRYEVRGSLAAPAVSVEAGGMGELVIVPDRQAALSPPARSPAFGETWQVQNSAGIAARDVCGACDAWGLLG